MALDLCCVLWYVSSGTSKHMYCHSSDACMLFAVVRCSFLLISHLHLHVCTCLAFACDAEGQKVDNRRASICSCAGSVRRWPKGTCMFCGFAMFAATLSATSYTSKLFGRCHIFAALYIEIVVRLIQQVQSFDWYNILLLPFWRNNAVIWAETGNYESMMEFMLSSNGSQGSVGWLSIVRGLRVQYVQSLSTLCQSLPLACVLRIKKNAEGKYRGRHVCVCYMVTLIFQWPIWVQLKAH